MKRFERFIAIDWSGAKGSGQSSIQVAEINNDSQCPRLVSCPSGRRWSRSDVLEFIKLLQQPTLVGIDFAFSVPWQETCRPPDHVKDTKALWALVEQLCSGMPQLYAAPIWASAESPFRPYIFHHHSGHRGERYVRNNLREVERVEGKAISVYHMAGTQVGVGSFAGMRMLHHIAQTCGPAVAIWPFDEVDGSRTAVVEIYPSFFYRKAGSNRPSQRELSDRKFMQLDRTLEYYGCRRDAETFCRSVDQADALISAAALKAAADDHAFDIPKDSDFDIREGWIFGVPVPNGRTL
jgi:hypothetical protein